MLMAIHPKLPMRDKAATRRFYIEKLGFQQFGDDHEGYLMVQKDGFHIHFFEFKELDPKEDDRHVYIRTDAIDELYKVIVDMGMNRHPAGHQRVKPWRQKEFAMLDTDNNLLTFEQGI